MPEMDLLSLGAGVGVGLAAAYACGAPTALAAAPPAASSSAGLKFSHMGIFAVDPETLGTLCGGRAPQPR